VSDTSQLLIGCDIGNVISGSDTDTPESQNRMFTPDFLDTPVVDGAIETLAWLRSRADVATVRLLSKCGPEVERKTRLWLDHVRFAERTGIPTDEEHLTFCRRRKDKAGIVRAWGLTHFIDDREDILVPMLGLPRIKRLYLFRPDRPHAARDPLIRPVSSWAELRSDVEREFPTP
jgi:hypothetical protein